MKKHNFLACLTLGCFIALKWIGLSILVILWAYGNYCFKFLNLSIIPTPQGLCSLAGIVGDILIFCIICVYVIEWLENIYQWAKNNC